MSADVSMLMAEEASRETWRVDVGAVVVELVVVCGGGGERSRLRDGQTGRPWKLPFVGDAVKGRRGALEGKS